MLPRVGPCNRKARPDQSLTGACLDCAFFVHVRDQTRAGVLDATANKLRPEAWTLEGALAFADKRCGATVSHVLTDHVTLSVEYIRSDFAAAGDTDAVTGQMAVQF